MACYFRKSDTIAVGLTFLSKILKYILHNIDSSSIGVALTISSILHFSPGNWRHVSYFLSRMSNSLRSSTFYLLMSAFIFIAQAFTFFLSSLILSCQTTVALSEAQLLFKTLFTNCLKYGCSSDHFSNLNKLGFLAS